MIVRANKIAGYERKGGVYNLRHLVIKAQNKNETAFVKLMEMNKQGMYKVAKSYLKSEEDVADAMQDTILTCYEKLDSLREPRYFKTWMIRILINKCKDILKKNKELCLLDEMPEIEDRNTVQENMEFMDFLSTMDEKYRIILLLYYVEGFNTREIGELLEMNEHTIKTRLVRARKNFSKEYEKEVLCVGRQDG